MAIDQNTIRALTDRGVELNPPANELAIAHLEKEYATVVGGDFRSVYSLFDGFLVHDGSSMLMLWGVAQIIAAKDIYRSGPTAPAMVPIGDYLLESDVLVANITERDSSVRLLYEEREIAKSITEFVELLIAGKFDVH